jgi:ring-1,2-phenylacetyl-CoA epoxidase subunit PaaE
MALHFHSLVIKKIVKETKDCVSISFHIPHSLQNTFQFQHGQNITLKAIINNEEIRRSYSICTAPYEGELTVAIKKVPEGIFSTYANELLKVGDSIDVMPPTGKFNSTLDKKQTKKYLAVAAGSGITPILSIIKTTLHEEPHSHFTLLYSNKSRSSIIFFEAIEALKNKYMNRFSLIHLLSKEKTDATINFGRINEVKLHDLSKLINYKGIDEVFICGPEEMIFTSKDFFEKQGLDKKSIHFELFVSATPKKKSTISAEVIDKTPKSRITVKLDGRSFDFKLGFKSDSILDAALQEGADLPFACKGGVCCTCKAKLVEGQVSMDVNYALEPEEVAEGYILTCQSHPLTERVVVDFDVK